MVVRACLLLPVADVDVVSCVAACAPVAAQASAMEAVSREKGLSFWRMVWFVILQQPLNCMKAA
ncbi:hypothetical protein AA18890_3527 [Komagataeibacter europaeus LMG 18890]|nr:hypothetical protein AA18890_3527 [Komagataeibacter europaeus LMG 18890]